MLIGDRTCAIREAKHLSQGDIENRAGLKRSYISRVENGHTVQAVETLAKFARALEIPRYQLFYEGERPRKSSHLPKDLIATEVARGRSGKEARFLARLRRLPHTHAAVVAFQLSHELLPDGEVGPQTASELGVQL